MTAGNQQPPVQADPSLRLAAIFMQPADAVEFLQVVLDAYLLPPQIGVTIKDDAMEVCKTMLSFSMYNAHTKSMTAPDKLEEIVQRVVESDLNSCKLPGRVLILHPLDCHLYQIDIMATHVQKWPPSITLTDSTSSTSQWDFKAAICCKTDGVNGHWFTVLRHTGARGTGRFMVKLYDPLHRPTGKFPTPDELRASCLRCGEQDDDRQWALHTRALLYARA